MCYCLCALLPAHATACVRYCLHVLLPVRATACACYCLHVLLPAYATACMRYFCTDVIHMLCCRACSFSPPMEHHAARWGAAANEYTNPDSTFPGRKFLPDTLTRIRWLHLYVCVCAHMACCVCCVVCLLATLGEHACMCMSAFLGALFPLKP